MIIARQEYTVAPGQLERALAWLHEVRGWESYRLLYPRGCRIYATQLGRVHKVVVEAEYASLLERLACLRTASRRPEYQAWRQRQEHYCLHVYGGYACEGDAEADAPRELPLA
ncbi:MAG: hypothetical protein ACUVX9_07700 [Anaerolineae bacterium]